MALHDITAEICCGCRACEQICPKHCISMEKDFEGFYIPNLDSQECIECGLCEKVCPIRTKPTENTIDNIYAMQLKDETELMKSSSGGAFRLIADFIIDNNGMVCSCAFDSSNKAVFRTATSKDDLDDFQGSKYVQSDTGNAYSVIRDYLKKGKTVFFSGAPCQCAALLNFLGVPFDNLYTADFLCHGMPSGWIFEEYIQYLEDKSKCKISDIKFRDKSARGWGLWFSYNQVGDRYIKKVIRNASVDPYEYAFQNSMMNRLLCYKCPFQGKRYSDFTYADYWGVEKYHPEIAREKGVSIICANTVKANRLLLACRDKAQIIETSLSNAAEQNESLIGKEERPIPVIRNTIYDDVKKYGWENVRHKVLRYRRYWVNRVWYSLPHTIIRLIKKI